MAGKVFVIGEEHEGQLKRGTAEIVGALVKQGVDPVGVVSAASVGPTVVEALGKAGASLVIALEHAELGKYTTEGYANAVHAYLAGQSPAAVIAGATSQGKDFLPRVAAKFKVGMATDCTEFTASGGTFS